MMKLFDQRVGGVAAIWLLSAALSLTDEPRAHLDYFEREVRPILADHCLGCHGEKKQESDLRLDSRERLLRGGVSGPAVVPGNPDKSLVIQAIRYAGDLQMPPKGKLTEAQIAAIAHWVKLGAPWPTEAAAGAQTGDQGKSHWAFQPLRDPPVPDVVGNHSQNPIDAFVRAKLLSTSLAASPQADPRTLVRRITYGLTGLPPSPEEVEAFLGASPSHPPSVTPSLRQDGKTERQSDRERAAYEALISRLLASPHYGEHWGRHWLDVARYSDTKGYVYAREQRFWVHAWVYRDWVVQALNQDLPYDQFLLLQIAADQAAPNDKSALAAMGFLTLGRRFLGVSREIIDDRIDVVTRGTMGLTVACARCHDHKYDPIPTRDYYSLYGVFQSCSEHLLPIGEPPSRDSAYDKWSSELTKRRDKLAETMAARRLETASRNRSRAGDYLAAQLELHKYPPEGFDQILAKTDLLPTFVHRWRDYLETADKRRDPVFGPWHAFAQLPPREFSRRAAEVTRDLQQREAGEANPLVSKAFARSPASLADVAQRYGELFAAVDQQWQAELQAAAREERPPMDRLVSDAAEAIRQVLYGASGPCEVPEEPIVNIEYHFDSASCDELWKLQNQVDNWILQTPAADRHALVLRDRLQPTSPHVFKRGNPANLGDEVPRQFVAALAGPQRQPFSLGSGRLELARSIIDPKNPLTPRVIVNRVWAHHYGAGLVKTPSDFGTRAEAPSHPELLDWLTSRFIEDGWSLKKLHQRILSSETYQQSSRGPANESELARARQIDPENRLLWRMNERRLSFEEMRDSFLMAAGQLDPVVGGRAGDLLSPKFTRRSLYGSIDRQFLPSTLRVFDFANPDLHIPLRSETTVPQQALFFLNHSLVIGYAKALAASTTSMPSDEDRVQALYRQAFQRPATEGEAAAALEFVRDGGTNTGSMELSPWEQLAQVLLASNEFLFVD